MDAGRWDRCDYRLHIFPHRAGLGEVERRHARIHESFRQAEATPPLS